MNTTIDRGEVVERRDIQGRMFRIVRLNERCFAVEQWKKGWFSQGWEHAQWGYMGECKAYNRTVEEARDWMSAIERMELEKPRWARPE